MANEVKNSNNKSIIISSVVLAVVILVTVGLKFYTYTIESGNKKLDNEISEMRNEIEKIKEDKLVAISEAVQSNKTVLDSKEKLSDIPKYFYTLANLAKNYDLTLDGFNYSKGVISTEALIQSDDEQAANKKLTKFLNEYKNSDTAVFDVNFIGSFKGDSEIKFSLELRVK